MSVTALIVAAGRGHRAGQDLPKQYVAFGGEAVLTHTLRCFIEHPQIDSVHVVINPDDRSLYDDAVAGLPVAAPIHGGATRQETVRLGLQALAATPPDHILVHDAARPFVSKELIDRVLHGLQTTDAVIPALALTDTVKRVEGDRVVETLDRAALRRAQTPQGFKYRALLSAHEAMADSDMATDDAAIVEQSGQVVTWVDGDDSNIKLTDPQDFALLQWQEKARMVSHTGSGFDVHRVGDGDGVMLCGVRVPHTGSLIGHSDADVALHALTDALLGAIAEGDIGRHFPPSDDTWKGVNSQVFVEHAVSLIKARGGEITNVDVTIICETPKITPHAPAMCNRVAGMLGVNVAQVSIKATTTEKLGTTGQGGGIAAQSIATVLLPQKGNWGE
jgi:2-C-methyl-D-erythritol 4-phosphate cytidylyltransferase / 2-C-methyl-D-erythritol 2,4-cyclodiphosphate synthase